MNLRPCCAIISVHGTVCSTNDSLQLVHEFLARIGRVAEPVENTNLFGENTESK
jgi:hypothetical protein